MKKILFALVLLMVACTENTRVRKYGGTGHITMEHGDSLVSVTWKADNIWILSVVKPMETDSTITYRYKEHSPHGVIEGQWLIVSRK